MPNPEGFDDILRALCSDECAEYGDPPCWKPPEKVSDCEHITPCADCLAKAAAYKATMRAAATVESEWPETLRKFTE